LDDRCRQGGGDVHIASSNDVQLLTCQLAWQFMIDRVFIIVSAMQVALGHTDVAHRS
jgi:hypothetical protein